MQTLEQAGEGADAGPARRWYLVQAQTGREQIAFEHLKRQGFFPFLPSTWRSIRHARKIRTERCAYFPGYLFVALDLERERWRSIDGTFGVVQIVKASGRPLAAPKGLVEALLGLVDSDGAIKRLDESVLQAGDRVRLIRGPFAEHLAKVERADGRERVRILLSMMGQAVPVEVSRQDLALA
ncbi:MAG: hypothetical protein JNJ63_11200 [Hyphomonadaceae bacterium]|nr:hypothetical protein [Hyphomonadaceae bacterium]